MDEKERKTQFIKEFKELCEKYDLYISANSYGETIIWDMDPFFKVILIELEKQK